MAVIFSLKDLKKTLKIQLFLKLLNILYISELSVLNTIIYLFI